MNESILLVPIILKRLWATTQSIYRSGKHRVCARARTHTHAYRHCCDASLPVCRWRPSPERCASPWLPCLLLVDAACCAGNNCTSTSRQMRCMHQCSAQGAPRDAQQMTCDFTHADASLTSFAKISCPLKPMRTSAIEDATSVPKCAQELGWELAGTGDVISKISLHANGSEQMQVRRRSGRADLGSMTILQEPRGSPHVRLTSSRRPIGRTSIDVTPGGADMLGSFSLVPP